MTDSPYVTETALIAVTEALLGRLNNARSATQEASFGPAEPSITFKLTNPTATLNTGAARQFSRFIKINSTTITTRLDAARTGARNDGHRRSVDLDDLTADTAWPTLTITVGSP